MTISFDKQKLIDLTQDYMLKKIISPVYEVFNKYINTINIHDTSIFITPEQIYKITSKKLFDMDEEDFGEYPGRAITTWGDKNDYKHFLPRILELQLYKHHYGFHSLKSKLESSNFEKWPTSEKLAMMEFIEKYFVYLFINAQGFYAEELIDELREIIPELLSNNSEILFIMKEVSYNLRDYNIDRNHQIFNDLDLIHKFFGEKAAVEYIINWPMDIENLLRFCSVIYIDISEPCMMNEAIAKKMHLIHEALKTYSKDNKQKHNVLVPNNIRETISDIEIYLLDFKSTRIM